MQNRTLIAAEARPPLPDFTPVPRKYRHDGWTPERGRGRLGVGGGDIPEGCREWIEAAEGRGEATPAVPPDGVAEVKKRPSWRPARKATGN